MSRKLVCSLTVYLFAATGLMWTADAALHQQLRERPEYRLLAAGSGTFLYALDR